MHGNMVFSRESIFPTPQQSGCLCVCIVDLKISCFGHFVSMCFVLVHIYFEIYKTSLVNQYKTH